MPPPSVARWRPISGRSCAHVVAGIAATAALGLACGRAPATWTEPHTGMTFARVPAGDFVMGSPTSEAGREAQEQEHAVRISQSFYLGEHEVTQGQWQRVMGSNPSWFQGCGPDCPVERVSALDIESFLRRLEELGSGRFRLPTEAEWEYACRAGTTTPFHTGAILTTYQANYDGAAPGAGAPAGLVRDSTKRVGSFAPNAWGLFDLHGNVWEWTADAHCPYPSSPSADPITDPRPTCASDLRVIRGGSWHFGADSARCALRYTHRPQDSGFSLGFRLVAAPDSE